MNAQERYDDISAISGFSEAVVRGVLKASRQSLVKSAERGEKATLPGICTIEPELKHKIVAGGEIKSFTKLKAKASSALETELLKINQFKKDATEKTDSGLERLNLVNPQIPTYSREEIEQVRTRQISALL